MTQTKLLEDVKRYVQQTEFLEALDLEQVPEVSFLAQGEYNINFLLQTIESGRSMVLRLNTGSQMHLEDQIRYEYQALHYLASSGVTPKPLMVDDSCQMLPFGMLVMEFLPGRSMIYERDLAYGARVLARIHQVPVPKEHQLIIEYKPLSGIWQECSTLIPTYLDSELGQDEIKRFLERLVQGLDSLRGEEDQIMELMPLSIVNTEVNSGNFLIDAERDQAYLVDWEKPLVTSPLQDLSHFRVPTTTLWKTDYRMTKDDQEKFVRIYCAERGFNEKQVDNLQTALQIFDQFSAMRGISWSAMAWIEYQKPGRIVRNEDTFAKLKQYLRKEFLDSLFPQFI